MFTVISYDVVNDTQRTKVHKYLKGYGTWVQYSVFECELDAAQLASLQQALRTMIDANTDSVRFYPLDAAAVRRIQILGIGRVTTEPLHYMVG